MLAIAALITVGMWGWRPSRHSRKFSITTSTYPLNAERARVIMLFLLCQLKKKIGKRLIFFWDIIILVCFQKHGLVIIPDGTPNGDVNHEPVVGAITIVSQEAAQVLESAGEGPLGKVYKEAFFLRILVNLIFSVFKAKQSYLGP